MQIAVAPLTSDIPEFHDCQKFIDHEKRTYLGLVAVFAHQSLVPLWDSLGRLGQDRTAPSRPPPAVAAAPPAGFPRPSPPQPRPPNTLAFAEVLNYGEPYGPLGIARGYNCLFIFDTISPRAVMVPVTNDLQCTVPARFDTLLTTSGATELAVVRTKVAGYSAADYPPVARWDWDPKNNHQTMGLTCGAAWCDVGEKRFTPSTGYVSGASVGMAGRVVAIKGWYDEQELALRDAQGNLYPGKIKGTVFPHPKLDTYTLASFDNRWVPVAFAVLKGPPSEYEEKLNLRPTPPGTTSNALFVCRGSKLRCVGLWPLVMKCDVETGATIDPAKWWVRIGSGKGAAYRCVTRFVPSPTVVAALGPEYKTPGTARWRWIASDETIWEACAGGCCQAQGFGS
ncbi:MAG TPA: hypothetical protein VFZ21_25645 [Gemmatimonadaceae bacterium]|nr:hypothetical protein [Gemmatimonadaceae bacterium]